MGIATYDPATDAGYVRLLITDTNVGGAELPIFDDAEIAAYLDREGNVFLAAAAALESIATSEVLIQKRITLLDLQTDGPAEAAQLLKLATSMRERGSVESIVDPDDDESGFGIAEMVTTPASAVERMENGLARGLL